MFIAALLHITLAMSPLRRAPLNAEAAAAEAAALWAPYGVASTSPRRAGAVRRQHRLIVVPVETPTHRRPPGCGSPRRDSLRCDSAPAPRITLFLTDLLAFVASGRMFGQPERQWRDFAARSSSLGCSARARPRDRPFVLRMPRHCGGLMRPLQFADELVAPSRRLRADRSRQPPGW